MKARTSLAMAVLGLALCGVAEAARLPKPTSTMDRVNTSWSRGTWGIRDGKYNRFTWGNRWWQTLGPAPLIMIHTIKQY